MSYRAMYILPIADADKDKFVLYIQEDKPWPQYRVVLFKTEVEVQGDGQNAAMTDKSKRLIIRELISPLYNISFQGHTYEVDISDGDRTYKGDLYNQTITCVNSLKGKILDKVLVECSCVFNFDKTRFAAKSFIIYDGEQYLPMFMSNIQIMLNNTPTLKAKVYDFTGTTIDTIQGYTIQGYTIVNGPQETGMKYIQKKEGQWTQTTQDIIVSVSPNASHTIKIVPFSHAALVMPYLEQIRNLTGKDYTSLSSFCTRHTEADCQGDIYMYIANGTLCGFLIALSYNAFVEVYDLHTFKDFRKNSVASRLLAAVKQYSFEDYFWAGIFYHTPHYDVAAKTFVKAGFTTIYESTKSLGGVPIGNGSTNFLNMFCNRLHIPTSPVDVATGLALKKLKLDETFCKRKYIIDGDTVAFLHAQLEKDHEVGGHLTPTKDNKLFYDMKNVLYNGPVPEPGTLGYYVNFDRITEFMFHTHPRVCYEESHCKFGWPSGGDMIVNIGNYNRLKAHFVVTCEGIYVLQLSARMQYFLKQIEEIFFDIGKTRQDINTFAAYLQSKIKEDFDKLHVFREEKVYFINRIYKQLSHPVTGLPSVESAFTNGNLNDSFIQGFNSFYTSFSSRQDGDINTTELVEQLRVIINDCCLKESCNPNDEGSVFNEYMKYIRMYTIENLLMAMSRDSKTFFDEFGKYMYGRIPFERKILDMNNGWDDAFSTIVDPKEIVSLVKSITDNYLSTLLESINGKEQKDFEKVLEEGKAKIIAESQADIFIANKIAPYVKRVLDASHEYIRSFVSRIKEFGTMYNDPVFTIELVRWPTECNQCPEATNKTCNRKMGKSKPTPTNVIRNCTGIDVLINECLYIDEPNVRVEAINSTGKPNGWAPPKGHPAPIGVQGP